MMQRVSARSREYDGQAFRRFASDRLRDQLVIEIEIILPCLGWLIKAEDHGEKGYPNGRLGSTKQRHTCLLRSPPPFPEVTGRATRDNIRPLRLPTAGPGNDVVIGQLLLFKGAPAILTLPSIPDIEVLARKLDVGSVLLDEPIQTDNRRQP
jgi:hypothetical protein